MALFRRHPRAYDEKRIRDFIEAQASLSESPVSLASKLQIDVRTTRRVLERLAAMRSIHRRELEHGEPIYYHYATLEEVASRPIMDGGPVALRSTGELPPPQ